MYNKQHQKKTNKNKKKQNNNNTVTFWSPPAADVAAATFFSPVSTRRSTEQRIIRSFSQSGSSKASWDVLTRKADGGWPPSGNHVSSSLSKPLAPEQQQAQVTLTALVAERDFTDKNNQMTFNGVQGLSVTLFQLEKRITGKLKNGSTLARPLMGNVYGRRLQLDEPSSEVIPWIIVEIVTFFIARLGTLR